MTSRPFAIEVENLSKSYVISHNSKRKARSLRELLANPFARQDAVGAMPDEDMPKETFWALNDVSFRIGEGERVAIIGGNGAGKSTLLKILSRITEPTSGKVAIRGKVSSLLEVGTGFHPELTGRENIYLNGAILGMRRSEITAKFDQIVDFSGVEKFIDTPVKHYSSGMYVRLAFSVSAWLDPDILIVDEVLSVGDQAFQRRCAERMKELTGAGRTVLFVSHSMQAVKAMCDKAMFLERGRAVHFGSVDDAATQYVRSIEADNTESWGKAEFTPGDEGVIAHSDHQNKIRCHHARIINDEEQVTSQLPIDRPFFIELTYEVLEDLDVSAVPNFHFYDEFGGRVFITMPEGACPREKGVFTARCEIPSFQLNNGRYVVMVAISSFSLEAPLHFAFEYSLRLEVKEDTGMDVRRHGWTGALPGTSRPRLDWTYSSHNRITGFNT
uniref:ABC transporter ATP-binding protein n=1 Tax=Agrobacterium albertimagni TaxID=147266 RepID=A0A7C1PIH3_9HYPH